MAEFVDLLKAAAAPMVKVLCMCVAGTIAATETVGILTPPARATLARIILFIFLPPFLFSTLVQAVSLQSLSEWWPIPFFVLLNALSGFLLGTLLVWPLRRTGILKESQLGVFKAACTIGNVGQLPLALVSAACADGLEKMALRGGICDDDSQAMVSFGLAVGSILIWTAGPALIRPREPHGAANPLQALADVEIESEIDRRSGAEWAGGCAPQPGPVCPSYPPLNLTHWGSQHERGSASPLGAALRVRAATLSAGRSSVAAARRIVNPPIMACCAGVLCGSIPVLKHLFVGDGAPLGLVLGAMRQLGDGMIPSMLLVLGANMLGGAAPQPSAGRDGAGAVKEVGSEALSGDGERAARRSAETWAEEASGRAVAASSTADGFHPAATVCIILTRLVVLPAVGLGLTTGFKRGGLLPDDPLVEFVLLLQFSVPTAANLGTIATLYGIGQALVTKAAIPQYILAVPVMTLWMVLYLSVEL